MLFSPEKNSTKKQKREEDKELLVLSEITAPKPQKELTFVDIPNDVVSVILSFVDLPDIINFRLTSRQCNNNYLYSFASIVWRNNVRWQNKVFAELTEYPKLQKGETYFGFYRKHYELLQNPATIQREWINLFARIINNGLEKLIPKFADKITNVNILCDDQNQPLNTFLHLAAKNGHDHIIEYLLERGHRVDPIDGNPFPNRGYTVPGATNHIIGKTPLCYAAYSGCTRGVELLINKGAQIHFRSPETGNTPLHFAAYGKHLDCFKLLIEKGADPECKNYSIGIVSGDSALEIARKIDSPEWQSYLQEQYPEASSCSVV